MDQLSHPYLTAGRTIALSIGTFAGKVMPFLFNTFWFYHNFPCKEQACFNILAAVSFRGDYSNDLFRAARPRPAHCLRRPGPARLEAPSHTPDVPTRVRLRSTPLPPSTPRPSTTWLLCVPAPKPLRPFTERARRGPQTRKRSAASGGLSSA